MSVISKFVYILPRSLLKVMHVIRGKVLSVKYGGLSTEQVFSQIYLKGAWGKHGSPDWSFYSGAGSHDDVVVAAYVSAIKGFVATLSKRPNVVDFGCGDFFVGSKIRPLCGSYIACDIVPELIENNRQKYKALDVNFKALDLTSDELPSGDVVFIRQVLQHLSNEQILRVMPKLGKYKYLVLTEHLPESENFEHNLDKSVGPDTRLGLGSGVVLTSAPFNLKPICECRLCEIKKYGGRIVTTLYQISE